MTVGLISNKEKSIDISLDLKPLYGAPSLKNVIFGYSLREVKERAGDKSHMNVGLHNYRLTNDGVWQEYSPSPKAGKARFLDPDYGWVDMEEIEKEGRLKYYLKEMPFLGKLFKK